MTTSRQQSRSLSSSLNLDVSISWDKVNYVIPSILLYNLSLGEKSCSEEILNRLPSETSQ